MSEETAPWASQTARARIADVAAGLGDLTVAGVTGAVNRALRGQERQFDTEGIVLYAGTNVLSDAARAVSEPSVGGRPSMGWPGEKYQSGLDNLDTLEVLAPTLLARLLGARFAEVRAHSATIANALLKGTPPGQVRKSAAALRAEIARR